MSVSREINLCKDRTLYKFLHKQNCKINMADGNGSNPSKKQYYNCCPEGMSNNVVLNNMDYSEIVSNNVVLNNMDYSEIVDIVVSYHQCLMHLC